MKFAPARSRRYRRNFENFLHREWELVEILQKLQKTFFSEKFFEVEKLGQNCIFRILSEDFSAFFNRCCGNFELLGRDGSVFYPKVKKESKNSSIQTRTSRGKIAIFLVVFIKGKRPKSPWTQLGKIGTESAEIYRIPWSGSKEQVYQFSARSVLVVAFQCAKRMEKHCVLLALPAWLL